ncbi:MvdC/MvdD family ATP grasp protein [Streptomonospora nanhaiensis]|uniref:MvdC/MvdD family ATP grasp protein n=1 Tax=Streptomonospora nanhaiensis TaxID=1323731 RepID=UPI001C98EF2C|nr:hypothetical protein [Streptomonospora nanhaiensis]MBX9389875.1 hypothetical protein [Streptomonospora nanhaiensis]
MASAVLVLAASDDGEAALVADALTRRSQQVVWLDLSWFPLRASVQAQLTPSGWIGHIITTPAATVALADVAAVYSHHSPPFAPAEGMSVPERRFAIVEARFGLGGILASLPARWVSHPSAVADAEYKPVQLAALAAAGLAVPATWMGNDPSAARAFVSGQPGGAVYKAIMHKVVSEEGAVKALYTTPVTGADIDERVAATMHQFQHRVRGARDVRALVTSGGCEAVEITDRTGVARLDYRDHYDTLAYARTRLEDGVVRRAQQALTWLGLRSAVFDFAVTADRTWVYELNPGGPVGMA